MNYTKYIKLKHFAFILLLLCLGCENFIELETPEHLMTRETLFASDESARSAMNGIYNEMINVALTNGGPQSVTYLSGLSGGVLSMESTTDAPTQFEQHAILPDNTSNLSLWSGAYNLVYMVNTVLEGVENSNTLSVDIGNAIVGEAKFIRAFAYFYLMNLYGDVPLLLGTDYETNRLKSRDSFSVVQEQVNQDLQDAIDLLPEAYPDGDRTRVTRYAAIALLARLHLYAENWEQAESLSSQVINQSSLYGLEELDHVFLANSQEAIWQISPIGRGAGLIYTNEGNIFIPVGTRIGSVALAEDFMSLGPMTDMRRTSWINELTTSSATYHYPYKYKIQFDASGGEIQEYSMVMRLAEQYLIRAEARTRQGNLSGAISDLDIIKSRAGTLLLADTDPSISSQELLDEIMMERQKELFTEWGHRWLDLKRTGRAATEFATEPSWEESDLFYPIPEQELMRNPNL